MSMPLVMLSPSRKALVTEVQGGHGVKHRLAEMGISVGTNLIMIKNGKGPVIVEVRKTRVLLGHGLSHKIMVRPIS